MPTITKVVSTTIYRNYQFDVPEEFIIKHFGSLEAFREAFSGDNGQLPDDVELEDFFEELGEMDRDVVERESKYDDPAEYYRGKIEKCDRWVEPSDGD